MNRFSLIEYAHATNGVLGRPPARVHTCHPHGCLPLDTGVRRANVDRRAFPGGNQVTTLLEALGADHLPRLVKQPVDALDELLRVREGRVSVERVRIAPDRMDEEQFRIAGRAEPVNAAWRRTNTKTIPLVPPFLPIPPPTLLRLASSQTPQSARREDEGESPEPAERPECPDEEEAAGRLGDLGVM